MYSDEDSEKSSVVKGHVFQAKTQDVHDESALDPVYHAKAQILNDALQDIGMGKYQWFLFVVAGSGWLSSNLCVIITSLVLSPILREFNVQGPFLQLAQNVGLLIGAAFWGVTCDVWGRRYRAFNVTLLITGVFVTAAGASPNYVTLCSLAAVWSIGVGGNLPVDSAVFLEFMPASHQYLLTILSIWWSFGQLLGSLVAWPLISDFSCPAPLASCPRSSNQGWRYFLYTTGGLMILFWILRFFVFNVYESPKYLVGRGKDEAAVEVIHKVAAYNGKTSALAVEQLKGTEKLARNLEGKQVKMDVSTAGAIRRKLAVFDASHVKPLFVTRKLAYSTSFLTIFWALIGLAFPLYNGFVTYYLQTRGTSFGDSSLYVTYRNQIILSVIGIPGALMAGYCVELPLLGRRGTLSIFTILTGVFILASTTARTSSALLGWNCGYSFTSNVMYGVLYAVTPELFPTKDRGTGNAIVASANRVFGVMAPVIALYADLNTAVPIWVAGTIFLLAGLVALLLPEPRGKAAM